MHLQKKEAAIFISKKDLKDMLMYMCLPRFDIYQGKVASNCFESHINS